MFQVSDEVKPTSARTCWCDFFLLVSGLLLMTVLLAFYSIYLLHVDLTNAAKQAVGSNVTDKSNVESKVLAPHFKLQARNSVRNYTGNGDGRPQVTRPQLSRARAGSIAEIKT